VASTDEAFVDRRRSDSMVRYVSRRTVLAAAATALAGCASGTEETPTATEEPENPALGDLEQMGDLQLASPAFEDGGTIPEVYGRDAQNVNPPLAIESVPDGAESLTLILDNINLSASSGSCTRYLFGRRRQKFHTCHGNSPRPYSLRCWY
jgi:hypothetical protein